MGDTGVVRDRRRDRRDGDHDEGRAAAALRRRDLRDRGALGDPAGASSFKYWGRRIFLMAPLQHHFEMKAWSETKIMVRFWIVTAILCAAGFALFYKYFLQFRAHSEGARLRRSRARAAAATGAARRRGRSSTARSGTRTTSRCSTASTCSSSRPGVPGDAPLVAAARERGIPVWSEVELGYRLLPAARGSSASPGRTASRRRPRCSARSSRAAGRDVAVAGNVGTRSRRSSARDWVVCELSSFQLEDVHELACDVAVLLNLEPDHLDRHGVRRLPRREAAHLRARAGEGRAARASASTGSSSRRTTRCRPSR